jgi:hypothetical protein
LLEQAALLIGADLWLLERHRLASEGGETSFLERVAPAAGAAPGPEPEPARELPEAEAALDPALVELASDLAERLARLDPAIACTETADGLAWALDGAPLCRLCVEDGRLVGRLADSEVPHRLSSSADVDVFVDWVLSLHVAGWEGEEHRERPPVTPLLTREEIEAFRD